MEEKSEADRGVVGRQRGALYGGREGRCLEAGTDLLLGQRQPVDEGLGGCGRDITS